MVISETEIWSSKLGGTDCIFSVRPKLLQRATESLQAHLGETEIPIGKTDLLRVCGSGYDLWNQWRRIGRIGVTDFGFRFRSFVDVGK